MTAQTGDPGSDKLVTWLTATAGGDSAAFRRLYDATSAKLFGIVLRIIRDRGLAEEILQETYLRVWQKAEAYDPAAGRPVTWLALFPLVMIVPPMLTYLVGGFPNWAQIMIIAAVMVLLMTYVVMPRMTRLFSRWLYR